MTAEEETPESETADDVRTHQGGSAVTHHPEHCPAVYNEQLEQAHAKLKVVALDLRRKLAAIEAIVKRTDEAIEQTYPWDSWGPYVEGYKALREALETL